MIHTGIKNRWFNVLKFASLRSPYHLIYPELLVFVLNYLKLMNMNFLCAVIGQLNTLDFKLSPCPECCMLSFGWFPGFWILYAYKIQTPGNHPKESIELLNIHVLYMHEFKAMVAHINITIFVCFFWLSVITLFKNRWFE